MAKQKDIILLLLWPLIHNLSTKQQQQKKEKQKQNQWMQ